ncbi:MAG: metallophosphoesterase [Salinisphaeraceae bacterium]|nr:metallophosphoesterase [Salinisphaeraceae bacterium]
MPALQEQAPRVLRLAKNTQGRDYCVGDIHGMFDMLSQLLEKADFDTSKDRLISVGDLVDRGPHSTRATEFLNQAWFYAIRGNHEDMLIRSVETPSDESNTLIWANNGGKWWLETSKEERNKIYTAVSPLPLAIEVETDTGTVGIVHADIPPEENWGSFIEKLSHGDEHCTQTALWSRTRAKMYKIAGDVKGISRIYCGHNIVDEPRKAGNVFYIDTGAFLPDRGRLTMVDIGEPEPKAISVRAD